MDSTEFLATVNWETTIYDVVLISEETESDPAVWECRIKPKDYNDAGSDIPVELDFQLIDNSGHVFRITNKDKYDNDKRVEVTDVFRVWPECPHADLTAIVCKNVGDGEAPHVTPAMLTRLDETAKDYLYSLEKDILWKYPKDINEKWHPEGLVFSVDKTDDKIINWTEGKFVVTKWPKDLESEYRIENVISKSAYHPERKYTINAGTFTCVDDGMVYIYAVIPVAENELTASIVIEKTYRFERYYTDCLTILIGVYNAPDTDDYRTLVMQWGNGTNQEKEGLIVAQTAHSFTFGTCIKRNGAGAWIKSKADTRANAGTVGIVSEVIDADHFRYITGGLLPGDFVDGADYWLSTTTAGDIFIQSDPEVWEIGNVREFIGTGTANGLEVEIDLGDEITEFVFTDASIEDIAFDFNDVSGSLQTYYLDVLASFRYKILNCTLESDGSLTGISVKINDVAVTGLSGLTISTKVTNAATALNVVEIGDVIKLVITSFSGSTVPSLIRGKLKTQRL